MTEQRSDPGPPTLRDGLIRLDGYTTSDIEDHLAGEDDEHARRFGWYPQRSTSESVKATIQSWERSWHEQGPVRALAARRLVDNRLVGGVELRLRDQAVAEISYWVAAGFRQRGYAVRAIRLGCRYAMAELGVQRIEAFIEPDNAGSIKAAQSVGFQIEGTLRHRAQFGDARRDMLVLGLLPSDLDD